ncbi:hypothetical protein [Xaviernesmea rhizosphaerae]|nr:hypothetical protein [Xaviernesmea rhizosphaerae]
MDVFDQTDFHSVFVAKIKPPLNCPGAVEGVQTGALNRLGPA